MGEPQDMGELTAEEGQRQYQREQVQQRVTPCPENSRARMGVGITDEEHALKEHHARIPDGGRSPGVRHGCGGERGREREGEERQRREGAHRPMLPEVSQRAL